MAQYHGFRHEVESALNNLIGERNLPAEKIHHLLNGAASDALDSFFTRSERRGDGIFFSGRVLSQQVASHLKGKVRGGATIADPTCGAGDLLLACMAHAPLGANLHDTIAKWSTRAIGLDIHPEFAATTKARLALLAAGMHRGENKCVSTASQLKEAFANIHHADFFEAAEHVANADCVVMNPPFYDAEAPADCSWGCGKTQIAARFVEHVLAHAKPHQEIVAVLPDVLRSGSNAIYPESASAGPCQL